MVDRASRDTVTPERAIQRRGASEFIGMVFHGYSITHVDSPAHYFWEGQLYNGRSCNLITSREGATVNSIEVLRDGVVSRGVLLDVARQKGVPWMGRARGQPADLEAPSGRRAVRVEPGSSSCCARATRGGARGGR